jgi:formamidopyrimidine-DNA glycosylase
MPELPEVAITVARLRERVLERAVGRVQAPDARLLQGGTPTEWEERLTGRRFTGVGRKGKYFWLELSDGQSLLAHLRMTGKLTVREAGEEPMPYTRFRAELEDAAALTFSDARRLGQLWLLAPGERERHPALARLGPDALEEPRRGAQWHAAAQATERPIKLLLMDQGPASGLGNICAGEILFRAGIAPSRPGRSMTLEECDRLAALIPEYLRWAIEAQQHGDLKLIGEHGAENVFALYRREGQPCPRCGTPIQRAVIGGRGTYVCGRCQPPGAISEGQPEWDADFVR